MEVTGTQFILNKAIVIDIPNIQREEWLFANETAMSSYKIYYNQDNLAKDAILLEANLAEVLNCRKEFSNSDHIMILKYQVRCLMNMVPFSLTQALASEINQSNFLQPMELFEGQSMLAYRIDDENYLGHALPKVPTTERKTNSLFEDFIKDLNAVNRAELFAEDYYMPSQLEVSRDFTCSNPLLRCFLVANPLQASLERILKYMFARPFSKNQSMIFMELMPKMLQLKEQSNEFAKYFIDSPSAELNMD